MHKGVIYALLAAILFGASTPFAKTFIAHVAPVVLAGLLYLGSGIGLLIWYVIRKIMSRNVSQQVTGLTRADLPWLGAAIVSGGIAGPVLLMTGLALTPASSASLLLNMEGVLTAMLAWFVFKENFDRRIFIGMILIVCAGILLSWEQVPVLGMPWGAIAILAACLCWAMDNNFTRQISAGDAVEIAGIKGLVSGIVNLSIGVGLGFSLPDIRTILTTGVIGFSGYGLSLVLFVLALRHLGTARTGAYFSAAPFAGAVLSLIVLGESPSMLFWFAALLMGIGIYLHLTEHHSHWHEHEPMEHAHSHTHDSHHQHAHDEPWDGQEPHTHTHEHEPMKHKHPHYPDIHHRHSH